MMKRYIYIIGIVASAFMLLSGCMKLDTARTAGNIAFKPLIGHDTRAVESVPFPQDRSFKVWAVNQTTGETHIPGETITYASDGWVSSKLWTLDPMYFESYWPADLPMTFSPSNGLQLKDFDCSNGDVDILVAKTYEDNEDDDIVILNFDHVLSRVEFRMKHSLPEEMSVRLKKISMVGYANKGEYNTKVKNGWTEGERDFTYVAYDAGETDGIDIYSVDAQYIGKEFYVIPQPCYAALEVTYEVRFGEARWVPQTETIESLKTHWEPGKHYTYTVNLTMEKLTFTTGISSLNNRDF